MLPRVRLEAVRAASFFSGSDAAKALEIAYSTLQYESDYYLDYCYKETVRQLQIDQKDQGPAIGS